MTSTQRRQVMDLPEEIEALVTEHRIVSRRCSCGEVTSGTAPAGIAAPVQYGPRITAACAYLWYGQFLSRNRTCEAVGELSGVPVPLRLSARDHRLYGSSTAVPTPRIRPQFLPGREVTTGPSRVSIRESSRRARLPAERELARDFGWLMTLFGAPRYCFASTV